MLDKARQKVRVERHLRAGRLFIQNVAQQEVKPLRTYPFEEHVLSKEAMLNIILIAMPIIMVVLLVLVAIQPSDYRVVRSVTIAAPADLLFLQINDLKKWMAWNPWAEVDPNIKITYGGPAAGVGANYSWSGNNEVGEGRATIAESQTDKNVKFKMEFFKPMSATSEVVFSLKPQGKQTEVTVTVTGQKNFMAKAFCVIMSMDKMIGGKFEKALTDLKAIAESPGE